METSGGVKTVQTTKRLSAAVTRQPKREHHKPGGANIGVGRLSASHGVLMKMILFSGGLALRLLGSGYLGIYLDRVR